MEEEQYCLKWNNHQSTLLTVLTGLMDTERLADCILSAEGKMLKAHQVIISACSPYLEKLLNESRQPGYMPILIFSDLVFDELVAMKEYMYKGEVNIRQDALDSFLKAACNLQIKGLADGGGGGDEGGGGGGGKRKAPPEIVDSSPARAGRRRRRESRESDHTQDMIPQEPQLPQPVPAKKQNVFTAKVEPFEPAPVVKLEPIMDQPPMPQPQIQHAPQLVMKPEPQDHHEPETHDLTGLDDDEDYDYDMPGTSQPDLSQDISNWQMDNSMHSAEDFAASQSMNTSQPGQSSQDNRKKRKHSDKSKKKSSSHKSLKSSKKTSNGPSSHNAERHKSGSERTKVRLIAPKDIFKPDKRDGKQRLNVVTIMKGRPILPKPQSSITSFESTKSNSSKSLKNSTGFKTTSDAKVPTETKSKDDVSPQQKKFKPSSSLKKKRIDDDGSSGETSNKKSNVVQPLEFIDLSKSGQELTGGRTEQTSDNLIIPELDPLAPEQGGSSEVDGLSSSFPLFNFVNQPTPLRLIDNSPLSDDNSHLSDIDDLMQCADNDNQMSDNDTSGNLVIDEEEVSMGILVPRKDKPSNATNEEPEVESTIPEEVEVESKKDKEKQKKVKRRASQEGIKITLVSTAKGQAESNEVYTCMICSMVFRRERDLLVHGLFKHGETSPLDGIQCNDCELTTSTIGSLYSHQNSEHLNKPKFKCPHCIYEGSEPILFHTHIINNHSKMISKNKLKVKIN